MWRQARLFLYPLVQVLRLTWVLVLGVKRDLADLQFVGRSRMFGRGVENNWQCIVFSQHFGDTVA